MPAKKKEATAAVEEKKPGRVGRDAVRVRFHVVRLQISGAGKDRFEKTTGKPFLRRAFFREDEEGIVAGRNAPADGEEIPHARDARGLLRAGPGGPFESCLQAFRGNEATFRRGGKTAAAGEQDFFRRGLVGKPDDTGGDEGVGKANVRRVEPVDAQQPGSFGEESAQR